jgi:capsular polysaccharide biosynthesis protein
MHSLNGGGGARRPERLETFDSFTDADDQPVEFSGALVSLGFLKAAIGRRRRFWGVMAVVGFLLGAGFYVMSPHGYQASTSLLLTPGPYENINTAANDDQAMAESRAVAGLAVQKLGLKQTAGSFLATYKVAPITERVITITASGPSGNQAILNAQAVAAAFLQFRADEMQAEQKLLLASLDQQVSQARQRLSSIGTQISQLSGQSTSPEQQSQLQNLRTERTQVTAQMLNLQQAATSNQTVIQPATAAAVKGSVVMDSATLLAHSRLKPLILYAAVGLIGGLVLGISIVMIQALISDRLRRRDDIAQAIGAPVKLSVGAGGANRWLAGRRGSAASRDADVQRIAAYLGRVVPRNRSGLAALAVVSVDDPQAAAMSLVSLAVSCAQQGRQVVLADLAGDGPAASILGASDAGIRTVTADGAHLVLAVPERDDVSPVGPLSRSPEQHSPFTDAVIGACAGADLLLTLATLDPSVGGDHLSTWAAEAVAVVTAGRSSWAKIEGSGEMIRLSGARLVSAVLVGADKTDESLGLTYTVESGSDPEVVKQGSPSAGNGFMAAVDEGRGRHRPRTGLARPTE